MLITREIDIDMAHRVPNHKSKCRNLHGHRYKIECGVDDKIIDEKGVSNEGMVIDFSDLKETMMDELDARFDHGAVFYEKDAMVSYFELIQKSGQQKAEKVHFVPFIPTAENLAKYWYELMEEPLKKRGVKIKHIRVWETPNSTVLYTNDTSEN